MHVYIGVDNYRECRTKVIAQLRFYGGVCHDIRGGICSKILYLAQYVYRPLYLHICCHVLYIDDDICILIVLFICDRVRGNRSYVGEIDFDIQAKTV